MLRGVVSIFINTDLTPEEDDVTKEPEPTKYLKENGELDRAKYGNFIANLGKNILLFSISHSMCVSIF
jgi:hypothetical protein